ncbi:t-SNARE domain-containing protein 1-like [Eleutherodactylus coqui]|uniref:t-SNARE domain-containing protein 1-like n=1 Tax=Eleutherodactylus coqui TaxID=57060 RepID=UPI0034627165
MKITDYFVSKPFTDKEERPSSTPAINNRGEQDESMFQSGKSGSTTIQTPKKKRERFSDPELHKLVETILAHIGQLFGTKALNAAGKDAIWDKVEKEVNKVGGRRRTREECKKRWADYKRKVKQIIDQQKTQSSTVDPMPPLEDILSAKQIKVARFYKMDASDSQKIKIPHKSSADTGECASSNENILTSSHIIDSEEEFMPSQNKSVEASTCLSSTSYQDELISQSYEEPLAASDRHNPMAVSRSTLPHTATESQLQPETQMDQLVAQQKNIIEVLQSIQKNLTESQNIQNKAYSLVKRSFLELQNTLLSQQKASSDHSAMVELKLNSLCTKLDEMNSALRVNHLQEILSSDESELSAPHITSTPTTATLTPAKSHTPGRKRAQGQNPSPTALNKKTKQI